MDIASVVGVVVAFSLIFASILLAPGASIKAFIDYPSVMVVVGGGIAASVICFPLKRFLGIHGVLKKVFLNRQEDIPALIETIVSLAETARRDGLLALENRLEEVDNPFIVLGIQMAVDGTSAEVIEDVMRSEMQAVATRHKDGRNLFEALGKFAPAFGMIGTLVGLIIMLGNMDDPSSIGPGMAVALLTTLYGAILANVLFLPFAEKLGLISREELRAREIIIRGIMAIQSGDNPRVIEQKLSTFVPPKLRAGSQEEAA